MYDHLWRRRTSYVRQAILEPLGLQMLLAYADDPLDAGAVRYLTDFDVYSMYALAIVPMRGDVALAFGLHHSAYLVRVMDVAKASYFKGTYAPGALCRELLQECHAGGACRIGIVGGARMMHRIDADLRKHLADATFVDVETDFWRSVAMSGERESIEHLRRSARIASLSVDAAARLIGASCGPMQAVAEVGLNARRLGADVLNRELVQIAVAMGSPVADQLALPQHCEVRGVDAMAIEVSPGYRGTRTVCGRTFFASFLIDAAAQSVLETAHSVHASICELLRPGAKVDELLHEAQSIGGWNTPARYLSLSDITRGTGPRHRIELGARNVESAEMRPGMVLVVRTRYPAGPLGTIHRSDTVLVNRDGAEILTSLDVGDKRMLE